MRRPLAVSLVVLAASSCGAPPLGRPVADPTPRTDDPRVTEGPARRPGDPAPPVAQADGAVAVVAIPPEVPPSATPAEPPAAATAAAGGGGWPLFHGDPARTGRSSARPIMNPRILWRTQIGLMGWLNSPAVRGEIVIVPSSGTSHNMPDARDGVFALDLQLGKQAWFAHLPADANGVAVAADRVIATSDDGNTYALELKTGKVLWQKKGQGKVYSNPLILGDQAVVGDAGGALRSYALSDGAPRWTVQLQGAIRGGASSDGEQIYAVSQRGVAVALGLDGKVHWRESVKAGGSAIEGYPAPVLSERSVIIPFARDTYYGTPALIALSKRTGKTEWVASGVKGRDTWGNIRSTPALVDGALIYAEPYSGDVAAVDAAQGRVRYRRTIGACFFPQYASPAAAGSVVYVPRFDGTLTALRADNGAMIWQMYLGEARIAGGPPPPPLSAGQQGCAWELPQGTPLYATPAIADDGTILIGSAEGYLYAIGDGKGR